MIYECSHELTPSMIHVTTHDGRCWLETRRTVEDLEAKYEHQRKWREQLDVEVQKWKQQYAGLALEADTWRADLTELRRMTRRLVLAGKGMIEECIMFDDPSAAQAAAQEMAAAIKCVQATPKTSSSSGATGARRAMSKWSYRFAEEPGPAGLRACFRIELCDDTTDNETWDVAECWDEDTAKRIVTALTRSATSPTSRKAP